MLVVFSGQALRADFLTIYGGPTYNPATGGYSSPVLSMLPGTAELVGNRYRICR